MASRRQTMQANDSGGPGAFSRLPMATPSTSKPMSQYQAQQNFRASLAPGSMPPPVFNPRQSMAGGMGGPLRASTLGGGPIPPGSVPRQSMYRAPTNPLMQSAMKTPMGNSNARRGSMMPPKNPAPAAPTGFVKDPRQLRDRGIQQSMWEDIVRWLRTSTSNFDTQGLKMSSVTGQSFRGIFEHLVLVADPEYAFPDPEVTREKGKWEPEFFGALNALGYPHVPNVDVKWLATPSAPYSWPTLLGVLHWIVEIGKNRVGAQQEGHPALQDPNMLPEDFDDEQEDHHGALALEFFQSSYEHYLATGTEDHLAQVEQLRDRYATKNAAIHKEIEQHSRLLEQANAETSDLLKSKPDLDRWEKQLTTAQRDNAKYGEYVIRLEKRRTKGVESLGKEARELDQLANEIGQLEAELNQHQRTVQEQNISADEVIRMNTEHASLSTNVQDLAQKVQEARTKLGKLEIAVAQRGGKAEDLIEAYNDKLISIQLSGHDGADLTLDLNTATDNVKEILRGPDLVKDVRPTMNEAMTERQKARSQVESEKLAVEAELEQYSVDCTNESDKHTALRRGTEQITNEANAIQENTAEECEQQDLETERLEKSIATAKHQAKQHGLGAKTRLQALEFADQEQTAKVARLKADTIKKIADHKEEIIRFRRDVGTIFANLQKHAEAN